MSANWYKSINKVSDNLANDATGGNFKALQSSQALGTIGTVGQGVGALVQALQAGSSLSSAYGSNYASDQALGVGGKEMQQQAQQKRAAWSESAGALVSLALAAMAFML